MKDFIDKLVPEKDHGLSIKDSQPFVVYARAIEIESNLFWTESIKERDYKHVGSKKVTFEFEHDGQKYTVKQVFHIGDVSPELGQWVRGVAVQCQWFSTNFVMTHIMKPREK